MQRDLLEGLRRGDLSITMRRQEKKTIKNGIVCEPVCSQRGIKGHFGKDEDTKHKKNH